MKITESLSIAAAFLIAIPIIIAWPLNAYRLMTCDFKPDYKGEVIHALGIFTPTCFVTAWKNWDE